MKYRNAVDAEAARAGEDFKKQVGSQLGNLNAIGALRSGAAPQAVAEAGEAYSDRVGRAAADNTLGAQRLAFDEQASDREFGYRSGRDREMDARDTRDFSEGQRRYDTTMQFDRGRDERDFGYRQVRDARTDFESNRDYTYRGNRDQRADQESDRSYQFDRDRFGADERYRTDRARRGDFESDRGFAMDERRFGEDTRRYNNDSGFREQRATRDDYNTDRMFQYGEGRDKRRDYEFDTMTAEDRRRYETDRQDMIKYGQQARQGSRWGTVGSVIGGVVGGVAGYFGGGGVGAVGGAGAGWKAGGAIGSGIGNSGNRSMSSGRPNAYAGYVDGTQGGMADGDGTFGGGMGTLGRIDGYDTQDEESFGSRATRPRGWSGAGGSMGRPQYA